VKIFNEYFRDYSGNIEVRAIDGRGNNLQNEIWGTPKLPHIRLSAADYDKATGISGSRRPEPRVISNVVCNSDEEGDEVLTDTSASAMVWVWGQFLDHDIALTETEPSSRLDIRIPKVCCYSLCAAAAEVYGCAYSWFRVINSSTPIGRVV
jgi:hypothetical protein